MLTNNEKEIEKAISIYTKFANVMYNKMLTKKYGIKPCKPCGDEDNIGKYNIHVLEFQRQKIGELSDGDCSECSTIPEPVTPCSQESMNCCCTEYKI